MRVCVFIGHFERVFTVFTGGVYASVVKRDVDWCIIVGGVVRTNDDIVYHGGNCGVGWDFTVRNFMGANSSASFWSAINSPALDARD